MPPYTILDRKYLIGRVLDEDGFSITYVGLDLDQKEKVMVKEYYPHGCVTRLEGSYGKVTIMSGKSTEVFQKGQKQFDKELVTLVMFRKLPVIIAGKSYFVENGTTYIVKEFVEGQKLEQVLELYGGRVSADSFIKLMRQVMHSMQTVHEWCMIHGDISPDNMLIDAKGNLKFFDFSTVRSYKNEKDLYVVLRPGYAPAEQYIRGEKQGPWTDVYALCATIYRAITGKVPIDSMYRLAGEELPLPSQMGIKISAQQEKALMKGLALKAEDRYQSMRELEEAFFY